MDNNNTEPTIDSNVAINCAEEVSTNFVVSTLEDENDGDYSQGDLSLREAIANSHDGDTIVFDSSLSQGSIVLTEGALIVDKNLSIYGLGADNLTIDGNNSDRVFNISDNNNDSFLDINISDLTITGGQNTFTFPPNDPNFDVAFGGGIRNQENLNLNKINLSDNVSGNLGGGIYNDAGVLNLNHSQVSNNITHIQGGGIYNNSGTVNIDASTLYNNVTSGERRRGTTGGGILNLEGTLTIDNSTVSNNRVNTAHGGIDNNGTLLLTNSTISGNDGAMGAGGIKNSNVAQIFNSTIANNSGAGADGIVNFAGANLELTSNIIAGSLDNNLLIGETFTSLGNNLITNGDGVEIINQTTNPDLIGTTDNPLDPQLGELQNNGGATQTHALLENSPAINAGSNPNNLTTDQRGDGFDRTAGNGTDIGAFEVQDSGGEIPVELVVSTLEDENDGDYSDGDLSLREAIALANGQEGADTITFDSSLNGGTIILNSGELAIDDSLTISGFGSEQLTIDANEASRVFNLDDGNAETQINVAINGLKITGGNASTEDLGTFGGGIFNQENLELNDSLVTANTAVAGGGIYSQNAVASINNSAINNNSTSGAASGVANRGSGIANFNSTVEINNSSINDNTNTGIEANESEITIVDSSISANSGLGTGGISSYRSTVNLENSIVSNNSASALGSSGGITSTLDSVLNINNSTVTDNFGDPGNPNDPRARKADASGILTSGTANIANTTISSNRGVGIGIKNSGDLNITNSTLSGNAGTGIFNQGNGFVTVSNSTIANNQGGSDAGGIQNENDSVDSVVISSNIIANNPSGADLGGGTFTSEGNNLIGNGSSIDGFVDSDLVGTDDNPINPQLGELQDNGGLTETLALQESSPAIDAGNNSDNLATDQRGEGFDRTVGDATDIGAYEVQDNGGGEMNEELVVSILEDENDGDFSEGDLSLREAIALANEQEGSDTITFDDNLNGGAIVLDNSLGRDFNLNDDLSILGLGQDNLTLDGGFVFNVASNTDVTIDGLNFVGGTVDNSGNLIFSNSTVSETANVNSSSDYYAIISREGNADIIGSTIKDNSGGSSVGVVIESGTASIESSAITDNDSSAYAQAGVIIRSDATVDISNSTIANNRGRSNAGIENAGIVNISNSTIANNTGGLSAGGINNFGNTGGRVTLTSSILTNNTGSSNIGDISGDGEYISGGNNLISNGDDAEGFINGVNDDLVGSNGDDPFDPQTDLLIDPNLGELQNNGGTTETFALLPGSPAIDAGSNPNNLATDQRGEGFDRTVGDGTDIGAFEVQDNGGGEMPTNLIVSTLIDENDNDFSAEDLSLREAIAIADSGANITFDGSLIGGTIDLTLGELAIDKSVTIDGLGANNLSIDANNVSRIFLVDDGDADTQVDVAISGLTIANGGSFPRLDGGGLFNQENLTITDSVLTANSGRFGLAVFNTGQLELNNSLVSRNSGAESPIYNDGGTASIFNTTISENGTAGRPSAVFNTNGAVLDISNSTIADNNGSGAAVINLDGSTATVTSSIIADNSGFRRFQAFNNVNGTFISGGNNLIGDADGGTGFDEASDITGTLENPVDSGLGELQNNGGATETLALLEGSPAINAGSNPNNLATDQRGEGFDRTIGDATDIGAFEVQDNGGGEIPTDLIVSTLLDEDDGDFSSGDLSLREAIAIAESGETITFDSSLSGGTISLIPQELVIDKDLTILGLGAGNLTIDGSAVGGTFPDFIQTRVFNIDDNDESTLRDVNIDGLTITGGSLNIGSGGGISNAENLALNNVNVTDNSIVRGAGGGIANSGNLSVTNSLISNNSAVFRSSGGGIINSGTATIANSTIANNFAFEPGGGINNVGTLDITNSTITGNSDSIIDFSGDGIAGSATITSSIIANNGDDGDLSGEYISGGNNLVGNGAGSNLSDGVNGDLVGTADAPIDSRLGELQDNGGNTPTFALLEDSPAIDAGSNPNSLATDQRGEGFDRTIGDGTDIGAFELQTVSSIDEIIGTPMGDVLFGTDGSDSIQGLDGNDTINGLAGNDTIEGNGGNDSLDGFTGDDLLDGADGFDTLFGGDDNDTLIGGVGNDSLNGSIGEDLLDGGEGSDTLIGGEDNDTLIGGAGSDSLDGSNGDDSLQGNSGRDTLLGGSGNDTLDGGSEVDFLRGDEGDDRLFGGEDNDTLLGGNSDDLLDGGAGIDSLDGGAGNDQFLGGDNNDSLFGGNGDDTLDGGFGSDILRGDDGNDVFVLALGTGTDTIVDFNRGDNAIALSGGITYADLTFSGNNIIFDTETLATLTGVDTSGLTEIDFVIF